jgi:hypothetical protein
MTPDKPHVYIVQVLASVEVQAPNARAAKAKALRELAQRCVDGKHLIVRAEEVKP